MPNSIEWNFKLIAHHALDGFGGMGEGMAMQIAKDGRRIIWLAHENAPKNFTGVDVTDPRKPKVVVQTDLPQPRALQLAGSRRQHHGGGLSGRMPGRSRRASSCSTSRSPRTRGRSRSSIAPARIARRASAVVRRRRRCAPGGRRGRLRAAQPARRPVLPVIDVRNPSKPRRSAAGGLPARARATTNRRRRVTSRRPRYGLPRPQHQRLSAAAGPRLSGLSRRRRDRSGHLRQVEPEQVSPLGQLAALSPASPTRAAPVQAQPLDRHGRVGCATTRTTGRSSCGSSTAATRQSRADRDLPAAARCVRLPAAASARTTSTRTPRCRPPSAPTHHLRHLLQRRRARVRHHESVPAARGRAFSRPHRPRRPARPRSTTFSSTSAASSTRSTGTSAGSISSRWNSDGVHFPSPDIGMFGRRQRHARGHRIPVTISRKASVGDGRQDRHRRRSDLMTSRRWPVVCACCTVRPKLQGALRRSVGRARAKAVLPHCNRDRRSPRSDPAHLCERASARRVSIMSRTRHRSMAIVSR